MLFNFPPELHHRIGRRYFGSAPSTSWRRGLMPASHFASGLSASLSQIPGGTPFPGVRIVSIPSPRCSVAGVVYKLAAEEDPFPPRTVFLVPSFRITLVQDA